MEQSGILGSIKLLPKIGPGQYNSVSTLSNISYSMSEKTKLIGMGVLIRCET